MSDYNVIDTDVEAIMKESFIQYSMAVIVSRALPDVRDGLKPVHRRILYTCMKMVLHLIKLTENVQIRSDLCLVNITHTVTHQFMTHL